MRHVALKRLCQLVTRGTAPQYSETDDGTAWAIGQSCQTVDGKFDPSRGRWHVGALPTKGRLSQGDVLINSTGTGTLGRVALVDHLPSGAPSFADGHVTVLRTDQESADPRFIAYLLGLPSSRAFIEAGLSVGATKQMELSVEALRAHVVRVPPLAAQAEIAQFLDGECARIDAARQELSGLDDSLREAFTSRVEHILTSNDADAPRRKLSWEMTLLTGFAFPSASFVHDPNLGTRLLRGINVSPDGTRWEEAVYWPHDLHREVARFDLSVGDLVVGLNRPWVRNRLRCAIIGPADVPVLLLQRVGCLRPRPGSNLDPRFAKLWLQTDTFRQAVRDDAAVTFPMLEPGRMMTFRLPVPSTARQLEVIADVEDARVRFEKTQAEIAGMDDQFRCYRDALITEAVTGQLDVTRLGSSEMEESLDAVSVGEQPEVLAS